MESSWQMNDRLSALHLSDSQDRMRRGGHSKRGGSGRGQRNQSSYKGRHPSNSQPSPENSIHNDNWTTPKSKSRMLKTSTESVWETSTHSWDTAPSENQTTVSWGAPTSETELYSDAGGNNETWGTSTTDAQNSWSPANVPWAMEEEKKAKLDATLGYWKNGKHHLGERHEETERKLFGTIDDRTISHAGVHMDTYDSIPVQVKNAREKVAPMVSFAGSHLDSHLLDNIGLARYNVPMPVQRYVVPIASAKRDIMACAQTGSGKTAGFLFPILSFLFKHGPRDRPVRQNHRRRVLAFPEALVLAPTRELASQIMSEARKFTYRSYVKPCVVYGGVDMGQQVRRLERGCDLLIATPGRLVDHLERGNISFANIRFLVLDEADRMLDIGFEPQIRRIVEESDMPGVGHRQTFLFSATFPHEIQVLARDFLKDAVFLTIGRVGATSEYITQQILLVEGHEKRTALLDILDKAKSERILIFVETKRTADVLVQDLVDQGVNATVIHGDRTQSEREAALRNFTKGTATVMVATAVAARGLDIPNVAHVIMYDMPSDIDDYVHRIGRTGRAGNTGNVTAFFSHTNAPLAKSLIQLLDDAKQQVPSWLRDIEKTYVPVPHADTMRYQSQAKHSRQPFTQTDVL